MRGVTVLRLRVAFEDPEFDGTFESVPLVRHYEYVLEARQRNHKMTTVDRVSLGHVVTGVLGLDGSSLEGSTPEALRSLKTTGLLIYEPILHDRQHVRDALLNGLYTHASLLAGPSETIIFKERRINLETELPLIDQSTGYERLPAKLLRHCRRSRRQFSL